MREAEGVFLKRPALKLGLLPCSGSFGCDDLVGDVSNRAVNCCTASRAGRSLMTDDDVERKNWNKLGNSRTCALDLRYRESWYKHSKDHCSKRQRTQ